jgi:hypothetical protein
MHRAAGERIMALQGIGQPDPIAMTKKAAVAEDALAASGSRFMALTGFVGHGGLTSMLDDDAVATRRSSLVAARLALGLPDFDQDGGLDAALELLRQQATFFFRHLVGEPYGMRKPYTIHSNLISAITFPYEGLVHTPPDEERRHPRRGDSVHVPAAFTFVGQFIDHDLTANGMDLFTDQAGQVVDIASPLIDLDSVYGPRAADITSPQGLDTRELFDVQGRFFLVGGNGVPVDVPRRTQGAMKGQAFIADKRNDENLMILQIHLLLMKLHNRLINEHGMSFSEAHRHTVYTWQSIVLNDYLPKIVGGNLVQLKSEAIKTQDYSNVRHRPWPKQAGGEDVFMPHEFAIGFRFGHSQLRPSYRVNAGPAIALFNNRQVARADGGFEDLRGNQKVTAANEIEWGFFLVGTGSPPTAQKSKLIDQQVTSVVFDLPESAIPDKIIEVANLTQRNLIRSSRIGLCAGEDLAELYGFKPLDSREVEPNLALHGLYEQDGGFRTPLWYYVLREAELLGRDGQLGPAAGNLVAEVLIGGVYYNRPLTSQDGTVVDALALPDDFVSKVNGQHAVRLYELASYVSGSANEHHVASSAWTEPTI